jgi:methyl halide transferase
MSNTVDTLHPAAKPSYWSQRWKDNKTGWDNGEYHQHLPELVEMARAAGISSGAKILEPGAGRGHHGAFLASCGFNVTSYDISEIAVELGDALYTGVIDFDLVCGDCFEENKSWVGQYDALFDRAVLCAFPESERKKYIKIQASYIKPNGLFLSIPFLEVNLHGKDGPPFAMSMPEMHELIGDQFTLVSATEKHDETGESKIARECLTVWQKK